MRPHSHTTLRSTRRKNFYKYPTQREIPMPNELIRKLHKYADTIEQNESVQCASIPRQAAYTIQAQREEINLLKLKLNKADYTFKEKINLIIGALKLRVYLLKKYWNYKKNAPR